jgi:hypothetical protein
MVKKIINKMPQSVINKLFQLKYAVDTKLVHTNNLKNNRIVTIKNLNLEKKKSLNKLLSNMCKGKYQDFYFLPVAIIEVSQGYEHYLKLLNSNARSKIKRAAKKDIVCKEFKWDDYLDDIYDINTSSNTRQGKEMSEEYRLYPKKIGIEDEDNFTIRHIGAFYNDKLVGYIELYTYGNFCMTNRLLGHKEYLNRYIMNAMFAFCVKYLEVKGTTYLNYLTIHNKKESSLAQFKTRLGFQEYSLRLLEK